MRLLLFAAAVALALGPGIARAQSMDASPTRTAPQHPIYRPLSSFPKGKTAVTPASRALPYLLPTTRPAPSGDDGSTAGKTNTE